MRLTKLLAAALSALLTTPVLAAELTITITSSANILTNPSSLPPTTHATLLGPSGTLLTARLSRTNQLLFPSLPPGSHLLTLHTRDYLFHPYRLDVSAAGDALELTQTFRGHEWGSKGPRVAATVGGGGGGGALNAGVTPFARKEFYQQREGFNPAAMLKNPMLLIGLFSAAMVFGMPYLLDNMDPELKAEMEEQQKKGPLGGLTGGGGGDAASALQNFDFASWMAGKTDSKAETKDKGDARSIR